MSKSRKAIHFDLDTDRLKELYRPNEHVNYQTTP